MKANYENLKDELEKLSDKNYIVAGLNSHVTISSASQTIQLPKTILSVGNKLTINTNGEIVIGEGISHIRISGQIYFFTGTTNQRKVCTIWQNNTEVVIHAGYAPSNYLHFTTATTIISVSQGDVIKMSYQGSVGDVVNANTNGTYLTVEAID